MTPCILHLVEDWIDIFHLTYCRVDSSQRIDLELVLLQRGGIRLHGSVANMSKKPSSHESLSTLTFWTCLVDYTSLSVYKPEELTVGRI